MLNILVDNVIGEARGALPGGLVMPTILTMAPDDLSARIKSAIESIADPIRQAADAIPGYDLERVTFTLAITSSGEVSLLSLVKGGASVQTGIQITLTPKARQ